MSSSPKNPIIILAEGIVSKYAMRLTYYEDHENRMKALREMRAELNEVKELYKDMMGSDATSMEEDFKQVYLKLPTL